MLSGNYTYEDDHFLSQSFFSLSNVKNRDSNSKLSNQ